MINYENSVEVLRKVVDATDGIESSHTQILPIVTAIVKGKKVVDSERIATQISIDHSMGRNTLIDIHWEDYGYENYRALGLFGRMNAQYQNCVDTGNSTFNIQGDNYEIQINYAGCTFKNV